jgi:cytochrome P450
MQIPAGPSPSADAASLAIIDGFDLRSLASSFYENPYPTYRALQTRSPIHRLPDGSWFLTRYADLEAVYRDTETFSSDKKLEFRPKFGDSPLFEHHTTSLVFNDPPLHTRVRGVIVGALGPRAVAEMEPRVIELVDELLAQMEGREEVDLIEDFASAIPVEVIGNLLAVPREERGPLRAWSLAILGALEPAISPAAFAAGNQAVREMLSYLGGLVSDRRARPGDPQRDVLTRLLQPSRDSGELTEIELLQNCIFILNAGHETTTNLIGNGLDLLLRWPDERDYLLHHPNAMKTAVEEFLRFESSNQLGNRSAIRDVVIGGVPIPAGSQLNLCIGAANRDPEQFADPDRLDVSRNPNRHLAFATGAHMCAGMNIARLEARIALSRFLDCFPDYERSNDPIRGGRARFRGFLSLPVRVNGRPGGQSTER